MKILHLITRLDPGGSAENTLLTCQRLASAGRAVVLAAGPGRTGATADVGGPRVPVALLPHLCRDPSPVADLRALAEIIVLLRRERPDVVHTHSAKAGILGRWAALLARAPAVVHTPHGHVLYGYVRGWKNRAYTLAERLTAPLTDRLVALSDGELRESVEAGIGRPERWTVIPSGVDLERLFRDLEQAPEPPRDGRLRVGSVARLTHVKGLDLLIRAVALLPRRDDLRVVLWGDGELRDELAGLARRLGVDDVVEMPGTAEPVPSFLQGLDVYAQPSRNEGMGRALVMAQAAGLPVVATDVCGIPDVVRDGETGLLAPPEPGALAGALGRLVEDGALRRRLAAAARPWILSPDGSGHPRFSLEAMVWHLERLYEELARDS